MPTAGDSFVEALLAALARWDEPVSETQLDQLRAHYEAMVETNRSMNLTRITDPVEAAAKHYADSLALLGWLRNRKIEVESVLDVGTGAGFPAVPLAAMRPRWEVTAIDAARKKTEFVARTVAATRLTNLHVEHAHAAHWQPGRRFQIVVARALAPLAKCLALSARHVMPRGWVVVYGTATCRDADRGAGENASVHRGLQRTEPYFYDFNVLGRPYYRALLCFHRTRSLQPS